MPPMEADAAYQGCLPSCELQSRSLAVRHTGKARRCVDAILRWHTRVMQSPDCADVLYNLQIVTHVLRNLQIVCSVLGF